MPFSKIAILGASGSLAQAPYHCFRCGAGGNALDLWAALTRQPLYQAVLDLCERLGRPVPWLRRRGESPMSDP